MKLIGVMDIRQGQVVRATGGVRQLYPISRIANPLWATEKFLRSGFKTLYVADLDALLGEPPQWKMLSCLSRHFPKVQLWADAALHTVEGARRCCDSGANPVVGSETLENIEEWLQMREVTAKCVMSFDRRDEKILGVSSILEEPTLWPERIIAMNVSRVGSRHGPDFSWCRTLAKKNRSAKIYCAGGVRDHLDLVRLAHLGMAGALVASAVHDRKIRKCSMRMAAGSSTKKSTKS